MTAVTETSRASRPVPSAGRRRARAVVAWAVVAGVAVVVALLGVLAGRGGASAVPLDPTSTAKTGTKALVEVLRDRGTDVRVVHRADEVRGGTVLVDDTAGLLDAEDARRIADDAQHVVLVSTDSTVIEAFGVPAEPLTEVRGGRVADTSTCAVPAAATARSVSTAGVSYVVTDAGVDRCAPSGQGDGRGWGIVRSETAGGDVTLLGTTAALQNATVTDAGNASLALGLLGGSDRLTWLVADTAAPGAAPSLADLAPGWIPSALVTLGVVAVAAACWRGRRLGPLVVERMPVVVRAAETTEGRARLYARTRDRTHALDTLRLAAVRRIGRRLGLPRSAHVDEVVRAAATAVQRPAAEVGAVLVGGPTGDDAALVAGAAAVAALERAVERAAVGPDPADRPGRPGPVARPGRDDPPGAQGSPDRTGPGASHRPTDQTSPTAPRGPGARS